MKPIATMHVTNKAQGTRATATLEGLDCRKYIVYVMDVVVHSRHCCCANGAGLTATPPGRRSKYTGLPNEEASLICN